MRVADLFIAFAILLPGTVLSAYSIFIWIFSTVELKWLQECFTTTLFCCTLVIDDDVACRFSYAVVFVCRSLTP